MLVLVDAVEIFGEDFVEADIRSTVIGDFYRYWRTLAGGREMPVTTDVDPVQVPRHVLPHLCVVDVLADGRFRYRVAGTRLVEGCGMEITGRYADAMPGAEAVVRRFQHLIGARKPYHCIAPLTWSALTYKSYETVVCPLADPASGRVARLIGAGWFE